MYSHILHATDLCDNHFNTCQQAVEIAKRFHAKLYLLHVIEPSVSLQLAQGLGFAEVSTPIKDEAITVMSVLGDALGIPSDQQFVEVGSINTHVWKKAQELDCTLIIMGSHLQTKLPAFLGSSAHDIIHHARCDVLTLRG